MESKYQEALDRLCEKMERRKTTSLAEKNSDKINKAFNDAMVVIGFSITTKTIALIGVNMLFTTLMIIKLFQTVTFTYFNLRIK